MRSVDALVVTELFPPAVGGSGLLLREVYSRFSPRRVTVITDRRVSAGPDTTLGPTGTIERTDVSTSAWGLASPRGDLHHVRLARRIRRASAAGRTLIHCGRALPEGVAAWMNRLAGGARYLCWSHGEDITAARTSRELTWVMMRVFRGAAGAIASSHNTRALLIGLGLDEQRVHLVYPGVDPGRYHPDVDGGARRRVLLGDGNALILSVGRLQRRKGHDLAIEAMAALRSSMPGVRYAIVGDGDSRVRLEALARDLRVQDRVRFCGEVPEDTLPSYYAAADLFVMPNRTDGEDIEGFGIVFLEAAASGKASIGGTSGGVPEAVEDGATGLLVSGTDAKELATAIARLLGDPATREAFGRAGRARVLRGFTWDHAGAAVARVHDRLVTGT